MDQTFKTEPLIETTTRGLSRRRDLLWALTGLFWFGAIGFGMVRLWQYKSAPGVSADAPGVWPDESRLFQSTTHPTLVMLVHPRCACTRASLSELAKLMTRLEGRIEAHVLFVDPADVGADFGNTETWRSAGRIPGVTAERDPGGIEATRFGAATSGQTLLYGRDGRLLFNGGLTIARGHEGDSPGSARLLSLATRGTAELGTAPVFGCRLHDSVAPEFSLIEGPP